MEPVQLQAEHQSSPSGAKGKHAEIDAEDALKLGLDPCQGKITRREVSHVLIKLEPED